MKKLLLFPLMLLGCSNVKPYVQPLLECSTELAKVYEEEKEARLEECMQKGMETPRALKKCMGPYHGPHGVDAVDIVEDAWLVVLEAGEVAYTFESLVAKYAEIEAGEKSDDSMDESTDESTDDGASTDTTDESTEETDTTGLDTSDDSDSTDSTGE